MKLKLIVVLLLFFILFSAGCMAPTAPMRGIPGANGTPGSSTIDVNYTFTGVPGTGASVVNIGNATDALLDFTIPAGANGSNLDTSWNLSYYLRDTSRSLTGGFIKRDVNNEYLSIVGGSGAMPYGANLQFYGGANVAQSGGAIFSVGDAAGTGTKVVWSVLGTTDTPQLSLNNNKIVDLLDPTNAQDAATKHYVDSINASLVTGALTSTYPVGLSTARFVVGGPVNVFLSNDLGNQMNTISTYPVLSTNNFSLSSTGAIKAYVDNKTSITPTLKIGDSINYTNFDSNGFQTMVGSARPYRDQTTDAINIKNTATPGISVDPSESTLAYTHTAGLTDYAYTNMQLNHDKDLTATVYPHIHFFAAEGSTMPNFLVQYRWQVLGGTKVTSWTNYKCNMMMFPAPAAGVTNHNLSGNTTGIPVPAGSVTSDIIQFRIIRDHSNDSGVFSGNDPYTATVNVISFDAHFLINSLGSSTELFK